MSVNTKPITVKATIESAGEGSGGAFIRIPFDVKKQFGSGRPKIVAHFGDDVHYRGTLVKYGTPEHILIIRNDIRSKVGVHIGDEVEVKLELDTKPRKVSIPPPLQLAFTQHPEAETLFKQLSYTHQKEYAQYITEAKRTETQIRRVNKCIQLLSKNVKSPN